MHEHFSVTDKFDERVSNFAKSRLVGKLLAGDPVNLRSISINVATGIEELVELLIRMHTVSNHGRPKFNDSMPC